MNVHQNYPPIKYYSNCCTGNAPYLLLTSQPSKMRLAPRAHWNGLCRPGVCGMICTRPLFGGIFINKHIHTTSALAGNNINQNFSSKNMADISEEIDAGNRRHVLSSDGDDSDSDDDRQPNSRDIQMGKAIDTLRNELPDILGRGLQTWSIYDESIVLSEPNHYKFYVKGVYWYKRFMYGAKQVLRWYFHEPKFNLISINQVQRSNEVKVHWRMEGTSKISLLKAFVSEKLAYFGQTTSSSSDHPQSTTRTMVQIRQDEDLSVYEGIFTYRFNMRNGLITEHSIDKIMPAPKKFAPLNAISWWQRGKMAIELNSKA